jgi:hypothetical protein
VAATPPLIGGAETTFVVAGAGAGAGAVLGILYITKLFFYRNAKKTIFIY